MARNSYKNLQVLIFSLKVLCEAYWICSTNMPAMALIVPCILHGVNSVTQTSDDLEDTIVDEVLPVLQHFIELYPTTGFYCLAEFIPPHLLGRIKQHFKERIRAKPTPIVRFVKWRLAVSRKKDRIRGEVLEEYEFASFIGSHYDRTPTFSDGLGERNTEFENSLDISSNAIAD